MILPPPSATRTSTLFPYTALFRSAALGLYRHAGARRRQLLAQARDRSLQGVTGHRLIERVEAVLQRILHDDAAAGAQQLFQQGRLAAREAEGTVVDERFRSAERRVGNEGVSTCRYRWSPYP